MSKIEKKESAELEVVSAPVSAMSLVPSASDMGDGFKEPSSSQFLPNLTFVYPIMVTPETPQLKGCEWKLIFKNGSDIETVPKGTIFTLVDKRNSVRLREPNEKGEIRNQYFYDQIKRGNPGAEQVFASSAADYNDAMKRAASYKDIDEGYSMVIVALFPDGREVVLEFGAYKILPSYFYPSLGRAMLVSGMGVRFDLDCHEQNLKKSAAGKFYPDVKKFKQYEHIQLTQEQTIRAVGAINAVEAQYEQWLKR